GATGAGVTGVGATAAGATAGGATNSVERPTAATAALTTFVLRAASPSWTPLARGAPLASKAAFWTAWRGASSCGVAGEPKSDSAAAMPPASTPPQNAPTSTIRCDPMATTVWSRVTVEHDFRVESVSCGRKDPYSVGFPRHVAAI